MLIVLTLDIIHSDNNKIHTHIYFSISPFDFAYKLTPENKCKAISHVIGINLYSMPLHIFCTVPGG